MLGLTDQLMTESALPIGYFNLDLGRIVKYSAYRGWYLGLGGSTNDRFSRHIRLDAYGGHWFRRNYFDYGIGVRWLMNRQRQMELGLQFSNRSEAMGEFGGFSAGSMLSESEYKYTFYENIHVRQNMAGLNYSTRFANYFKAFVTLSSCHKRYDSQFYHTPAD